MMFRSAKPGRILQKIYIHVYTSTSKGSSYASGFNPSLNLSISPYNFQCDTSCTIWRFKWQEHDCVLLWKLLYYIQNCLTGKNMFWTKYTCMIFKNLPSSGRVVLRGTFIKTWVTVYCWWPHWPSKFKFKLNLYPST